MSPTVRRLGAGAGEAAVLRDLRLRALRDAPMAFASTFAREEAYTPEEWARWGTAEGRVVFIAEPAAGLASGVIDDDDPALAHLYAMWVAPEARGTGTGRALVEAVVAWALGRRARRLTTSVTQGNSAGLALYVAAGFTDTGRREPLGHSDAIVAVLERALS
jgi:GNAT superfamily N-acetyltransferase